MLHDVVTITSELNQMRRLLCRLAATSVHSPLEALIELSKGMGGGAAASSPSHRNMKRWWQGSLYIPVITPSVAAAASPAATILAGTHVAPSSGLIPRAGPSPAPCLFCHSVPHFAVPSLSWVEVGHLHPWPL